MSDKTGIEWTDATWNPVTGCSKVIKTLLDEGKVISTGSERRPVWESA